jgi:uncharacterized protein (TIGR03435 family)
MTELDDHELLAEYARTGSEAAFAVLVARYVNLVHSAAWRFTGNPHHAEEITQAVFIILARKAGGLRRGTMLSGWLYQTARLTAANFVKGEIRRQRREQEAYMQSILTEPEPAAWKQIAPLLDEAMGWLGETDRNAIVLRFFENKTARQVAAALKLNEAAAHKRVDRALEKLHRYFARRGVSSTTAIIAGAISANSVQAAPLALAKAVSAVAAAKGATASTSTLTLIKGALKIMAWTKAKTAIVSGVVVLLAAGTATVTVKEVQKHHRYPWQIENADTRILERVPPQVVIVPTIFTPTQRGFNMSNNKMLGMGQTVSSLLGAAYHMSRYRVIYLTASPTGNYDFIANLRTGEEENRAALRREIEKQFHLTGRIETRETDVLVLSVKSRNAPGLKPNPSKSSDANNNSGAGFWRGSNLSSDHIAGRCERYYKIPVIDRTGLAGRFDVDLKWNEQVEGQNPDAFKEVLLDQLGLELTPGREPIEMIVVEKAE